MSIKNKTDHLNQYQEVNPFQQAEAKVSTSDFKNNWKFTQTEIPFSSTSEGKMSNETDLKDKIKKKKLTGFFFKIAKLLRGRRKTTIERVEWEFAPYIQQTSRKMENGTYTFNIDENQTENFMEKHELLTTLRSFKNVKNDDILEFEESVRKIGAYMGYALEGVFTQKPVGVEVEDGDAF